MASVAAVRGAGKISSSSQGLTPLIQFVRRKGFVKQTWTKPRWIPRAPSKMFVLPNKLMTPDEELNQILKLKYRHQDKYAAITQYLYEDYLKNSDVGEAAKIEAQREQAEHERLLEENDRINRQVAERRAIRLADEAKQAEIRIKEEVKEYEVIEERERQLADSLISEEIEDTKNVITTEDQLEKAVLEAIDNPIDYEYSIDLQGHIYFGRYNKARMVPESDREKIGVPTRESELILGMKRDDPELKESEISH